MIHPNTELRYINDQVQRGVCATQFIPKGTLIFCDDPLDRIMTPHEVERLPQLFQVIARRYCYINHVGNYILCWDIAKHMNHRCDCNTLSTAYGVDVALRDIQPGEELTCDYALFNPDEEMELSCGCENCRQVLRPGDLDRYYRVFDQRIQEALMHMNQVPQPLQVYVNPQDWAALQAYLAGEQAYRSVLAMKYVKQETKG